MTSFADITAQLDAQNSAQKMASEPHAFLPDCRVRLIGMREQKAWQNGAPTSEQKLSDDGTRAGFGLMVQIVDRDGNVTDEAASVRINKMMTVAQATTCLAHMGQELPVENLRVVWRTRRNDRGFPQVVTGIDFDLADEVNHGEL